MRAFLTVPLLLSAMAVPQGPTVATVNDPNSPGTVGDQLLSLDEAIQLANGTLAASALSPAEQAQVVADNAFTFEESVAQAHEAGRFEAPSRAEAGKALLHGHCHHKAMVGNEVT